MPLSKSFFSSNGQLLSEVKTALPSLLRLLEHSSDEVRVRISHRLQFLANLNTFTQKREAKDFFLQDVEKGKYTLDITKLPLYEYQQQGMLHLAFMEKAILADDMGLGKTAQAIAAVELLRRLRGIQRVLVITPTSLKAEWEEQIAKFVNHNSLLVYGTRAERLRHYRKEAFFYLTNYEQVVRDREDIQRLIAPDIIILDEAQRIKNWRTKTASTLKLLESPYTFVLTGTPLENRIDDIYSIVQFLYPHLLGSLFRFNREFYQLDEQGQPVGYKNLHILHQRLKPILLRRLKRDVEEQLPSRTLKTYFVEMSPEQQSRYAEQELILAQLAAVSKKRPLLEEEFKKLQMTLASMRILCDTPYILDEECRVCPKLQEFEAILEEVLEEEETKIIIFSEWERMLLLVRELLDHKNIEYAWHTGSVDQKQRRDVIHHFKEKDTCRVFLSTDCGAVGLNLQRAHVVINFDLPWNPAKLEQRIARVWRKHQTKTVQVINLVSEDTIEHRMLGVLKLKQRLSHAVLDSGTIDQMEMPSGRKAFMEQLSKIMGSSYRWDDYEHCDDHEGNHLDNHENGDKKDRGVIKREEEPLLVFQQEVLARLKPRLHHLETYQDKDGNQTILAVVEGDLSNPSQQMHAIMQQSDPKGTLKLEVMDRTTFETLQRLSRAGVVSFHQTTTLYSLEKPSSLLEEQQKQLRLDSLKLAQKYGQSRERKERLVSLLIEQGFYQEAFAPLGEVFELALKSFATLVGHLVGHGVGQDGNQEVSKGTGQGREEEKIPLDTIQYVLVAQKGLPKEAYSLAICLREETSSFMNKDKISDIFERVQNITQLLENALQKSEAEIGL
ncbi:MAG: DEAD/DEAH box helicase [Alphaproteobacteria bacterium]|nr:DEAD/DEAH box helicase [Alphaproteobacteria bacterium]